jgi:hypothetical protein
MAALPPQWWALPRDAQREILLRMPLNSILALRRVSAATHAALVALAPTLLLTHPDISPAARQLLLPLPAPLDDPDAMAVMWELVVLAAFVCGPSPHARVWRLTRVLATSPLSQAPALRFALALLPDAALAAHVTVSEAEAAWLPVVLHTGMSGAHAVWLAALLTGHVGVAHDPRLWQAVLTQSMTLPPTVVAELVLLGLRDAPEYMVRDADMMVTTLMAPHKPWAPHVSPKKMLIMAASLMARDPRPPSRVLLITDRGLARLGLIIRAAGRERSRVLIDHLMFVADAENANARGALGWLLAAAEPAWSLATLPAPLGLTREAIGVLLTGLPRDGLLAWPPEAAFQAQEVVAYLARLRAAGMSKWVLLDLMQLALKAHPAGDWPILLLGALVTQWAQG